MRKLFALAVLALVPAVAVRAADEDKYTTVKGRFIWDDAKGPPPARVAIKPTKDENPVLDYLGGSYGAVPDPVVSSRGARSTACCTGGRS